MKHLLNFSSCKAKGILISIGALLLLMLPCTALAEHDLPYMKPAPGEYPDINGIPCGSWMAHLTLTEKCEELEAFFNKMEPLAEQGNPAAQTLIGLKYLQYPQTVNKAADWIRKAAGQGFGPAQYEMGMLCEKGSGGAEQSDIQAYKWYCLALEEGEIEAEALRDDLGEEMSAEELTQARKLVKDWKPTPFKKSCPAKQAQAD